MSKRLRVEKKTERSSGPLLEMPSVLIQVLFTFFDAQDHVDMTDVCREFNRAARSPASWPERITIGQLRIHDPRPEKPPPEPIRDRKGQPLLLRGRPVPRLEILYELFGFRVPSITFEQYDDEIIEELVCGLDEYRHKYLVELAVLGGRFDGKAERVLFLSALNRPHTAAPWTRLRRLELQLAQTKDVELRSLDAPNLEWLEITTRCHVFTPNSAFSFPNLRHIGFRKRCWGHDPGIFHNPQLASLVGHDPCNLPKLESLVADQCLVFAPMIPSWHYSADKAFADTNAHVSRDQRSIEYYMKQSGETKRRERVQWQRLDIDMFEASFFVPGGTRSNLYDATHLELTPAYCQWATPIRSQKPGKLPVFARLRSLTVKLDLDWKYLETLLDPQVTPKLECLHMIGPMTGEPFVIASRSEVKCHSIFVCSDKSKVKPINYEYECMDHGRSCRGGLPLSLTTREEDDGGF